MKKPQQYLCASECKRIRPTNLSLIIDNSFIIGFMKFTFLLSGKVQSAHQMWACNTLPQFACPRLYRNRSMTSVCSPMIHACLTWSPGMTPECLILIHRVWVEKHIRHMILILDMLEIMTTHICGPQVNHLLHSQKWIELHIILYELYNITFNFLYVIHFLNARKK